MTNQDKILERLERLEEKITPIAESAAAVKELKEELTPRINEAVQALIVELADVEADFQLENLLHLIKKVMRNIKNFNFALDMMHNLIDLAVNAEPLLKSTVPKIISFLDDMEQKNVFRFINTGFEVMKSMTEKYSAREIDQITAGLGKIVNTLGSLTDPRAVELIEKLSKIPLGINIENAKPTGPISMVMAMNDPDVKMGLGVVLELTRGLAGLKQN